MGFWDRGGHWWRGEDVFGALGCEGRVGKRFLALVFINYVYLGGVCFAVKILPVQTMGTYSVVQGLNLSTCD